MPYWYTSNAHTFVTDGKGKFIPCTLSNADWANIVASGESILPPPPPVTMPHVISRWQCAVRLREMGLISVSETLDMIGKAIPPAYVETLFAAMPPLQQQDAREAFGANEYEYDNPLIDQMLPPGTTAVQKDEFFRAAGQLRP